MEVEDLRDVVAVKSRQAADAGEKAKAMEREAEALQDEVARSNDLKRQLQDARVEVKGRDSVWNFCWTKLHFSE